MKRILDIGAADSPDKRATDAIDIQVSSAEVKRAKRKSKKLMTYYKGDFKHPPKEMKHEFDAVVSHFTDGALMGKSASKALNYITKDDATIEIEVGLEEATPIVQMLHEANFKILSIEAKNIPAIAPALGHIAGTVVIKAVKKTGLKGISFWSPPIRIQLPNRGQCKKARVTKHRRTNMSHKIHPRLQGVK